MQTQPYRQIPLYRRDGSIRAYAIVDPRDWPSLSEYRWWSSCGYAARREGDRRLTLLMHRVILGLVYGDGIHTDHINRDRLDNRRANLRVVSHAENMRNRSPHRGSSSKYRGVSWDAGKGKWRAACGAYGKKFHLGYFTDEDEAGRVAAAFRRELGWPE